MNLEQTGALVGRLVHATTDVGLIVIVAGMLLCVGRMLRGPHLADRALALDTLSTHLMALVILFTVRSGTILLFDGVLVLALLGFIATVAFGQHILRPHVPVQRDPHEQGNKE